MKLKIYQIDAFAEKVFSGNPAAVCPLDNWLSDELMLKIAAENNLSETAFYVKQDDRIEIRWFTPTVEVDLCGHATLATAFVLFNQENYKGNIIEFFSPKNGKLTVSRNGEFFTLNFPTDKLECVTLTDQLRSCFNIPPNGVLKGKTDYLFVFENEKNIINIQPNIEKISTLNARGVIVTAKGDNIDFVSRFFAPQVGVIEDPVTGSAHTTLIPYWTKELNKTELTAIQLSERRGYLKCKFLEGRVEISGKGKLYLVGEIYTGSESTRRLD